MGIPERLLFRGSAHRPERAFSFGSAEYAGPGIVHNDLRPDPQVRLLRVGPDLLEHPRHLPSHEAFLKIEARLDRRAENGLLDLGDEFLSLRRQPPHDLADARVLGTHSNFEGSFGHDDLPLPPWVPEVNDTKR